MFRQHGTDYPTPGPIKVSQRAAGGIGSLLLWRLLMLLLAGFPCTAQVNEYEAPSSFPEHLYSFRGHVYFSADDGIHGRELWRADIHGNSNFIKDITPGRSGSEIDQFLEFKGLLYFRVKIDGGAGEIWRTDGTSDGTVSVFSPSETSSEKGVSYLGTASSRYIYFARGSKSESSSLWYTDGTFEGTRAFVSPSGNDLGTTTYSGIVWRDRFVFSAFADPHHAFVWSFNETTAELVPLTPTITLASDYTLFSDTQLHFSADSRDAGMECWVTSGTPETTSMLADIFPGAESSNPRERFVFEPIGKKKRLIFAATHPDSGTELWESDGTTAGTRLFADLMPGAGSSNPYSFYSKDDYIYFIAMANGTGKEPWGYVEGYGPPKMLADVFPGPLGSDPYALCITQQGHLVFSALTPNHGEELWLCSSPLVEPVLVRDFLPGVASSYPYYTTELEPRVVLVATDAVSGREVWILDSDRRDVALLADIHTDSSRNPSSFPQQLTPAGELMFFAANDIAHGNELWCTDGSTSGTRLVKDILPGRISSDPEYLTAVGSILYFVADDGVHGAELWRSDGTEDGTAMVLEISLTGSGAVRNLTQLDDKLLFSARDDQRGEELWVLEPGKTPRILLDINFGTGSSRPSAFTVFNGRAYFRADDGLHGEELWLTNGTTEGTFMLRDIVDAPYEATSFGEVMQSNGTLYVAAEINGKGMELWRLREQAGKLDLLGDIASPTAYQVLNVAQP